MGKKRGYRSGFLVAMGVYLGLALVALALLRERLDEAIVSLLLLALLPCVIGAWIWDGIRSGVVLRQAHRSTSMVVSSVSRREQPLRFWLAIGASALLALALLAFAIVGIWLRLSLAE